MSKSLISRRPQIKRGVSNVGQEKPAATQSPLRVLGWKPFFQQQLSLDELTTCEPVRVMAVHRSQIDVSGERGDEVVPVNGPLFEDALEKPTVGDWLLLECDSRKPVRRLERSSLFRRMAPGAKQVQLIAANIDNVLIVTSCNHDFNLSRIERYLAVVKEAGCRACVVLTKSDLNDDHEPYRDSLKSYRDLPLVLVNALDRESVEPLRDYCRSGETLALLGSSGVGKSTLLNSLAGAELAAKCRFADCAHESEPGCAVRAAMDTGELDERRVRNWRKLEREIKRNSQTLAETRAEERAFSQLVRTVGGHARSRKSGGD